jgi:hypothetical protein
MKGLSQIIGVLLIVIVGISIISTVGFFVFGTFGSLKSSGDSSLNNSLGAMSSCIRIESLSGSNIYIRNCGSGYVTNTTTSAYLDGAPLKVSMSNLSLSRDDIGIMTADLTGIALGVHNLRVSNPNYAVDLPIEAYMNALIVSLRKVDYE